MSNSIDLAEDRDVEFIREAEDAGDVVGMFVSDEDGGKVFRRLAEGGQALADLQRRKAGIHEDAGFAGLEVGAVAGRTAAKDGEAYGHAGKLKRKAESGKRKARAN